MSQLPLLAETLSLFGARLPTLPKKVLRSAILRLRMSLYPKPVRSALIFWHTNHLELRTAHVTLDFLGGLLKCILMTAKIDGNVIELGTYKGGSTVPMAYLLEAVHSDKRIFACDTFRGHPYNDKFSTHPMGKKGVFSDTSVQYVRREFRRLGVISRITIVEGLFESVLEKQLGNERFSLAFVDCDLYKSALSALEFLSSRMAHKGRIVLHDYGDTSWGITKAVNEWCKREGMTISFDLVPYIEIL